MSQPVTWVVGAGGLLGSNVVRLQAARGPTYRPARPVDWGSPAATLDLERAVREFTRQVQGGAWQIAWCAGAGVTGTTPEALALEVAQFDDFLGFVETAGLPTDRGALFLASSAGALYAGGAQPPFDERSETASISPYGDAKSEMERSLSGLAARSGLPVAVGRIANLYGPGQNLGKPQGLLSQIVRAHLLRRPIPVFVSLDTLRDYLYAPDCAALVLDLLALVRRDQHEDPVVKILASQRALTIAAILAELRRLFRRPPEVIYVDSPAARFQVRDLRLRSVIHPELDRRTLTTLPAGLRTTIDDMTRQLQAGRLS